MKQAQNTAYLAVLILLTTIVLSAFSSTLPGETKLSSFLRIIAHIPPPKQKKAEELRPIIKHKFAVAKKIKTAIDSEVQTASFTKTKEQKTARKPSSDATLKTESSEDEFWKTLESEEKGTPETEATEEKTDSSFELLSIEEQNELINQLDCGSLIKQLIKTDGSSSAKIKQKILFTYFNELAGLTELLRSRNDKLVIAAAEITALLNYNKAEDPMLDRINFEQNAELKKQLIKNLALFHSDNAAVIVNRLFIEETNTPLLNILALSLVNRADEKSIKKAHDIISNESTGEIQKAILHTMLASHNNEESFEYARASISKENEDLKIRSLDIISYSRNNDDWDFLYKFKRYFFRSVTLMKYFIKVKAMLLTNHLTGQKRINKIREIISGNKELLAWLYLYAVLNEGNEGLSWVKENFSSDQDDLVIYPEFIRSLSIAKVYLKRKALYGVFGDFREKRKSNTSTFSAGQSNNSLNIIPHGDVFIKSKLTNIDYIQLDKKQIVKNPSSEIKITDIEAGKHLLKIILQNGEEVRKEFNLNKNSILPIELEPQDRIQTRKTHGGILMKYIPASEYVRGKAELEQSPHLVRLTRPFLMSVYEITNKQLEMFIPNHKNSRDRRSDQDEQPAIMVTWYEAAEFCNWLSKIEGFIPFYDENFIPRVYANGYRLPTEAEWEFAAGAGLPKKYSWGNDLYLENNVYPANFYPHAGREADGFEYTAPVGSFKANEFGIYDMSGNVSEWCNDWYSDDPYQKYNLEKALVDPKGPDYGSMKVSRGGSWMSRDALQTSYREFDHPGVRSNTRGFRITRTVKSFIVKINKAITKISKANKTDASFLEI